MACTSVIPVRRLDRTVDYVQNKAKTTPKSLEEAVDYAANRDKTESACFETGLGCTTTSAFEDMRLNTLRWHKETGVQGYHLVQSFAEGEVTPELAHQIGVEFAEQLLLGKYQAIVTTHLNTKHYHNHIVWSAVSLEDGKKYHSNSKSYYTEVRALSDALCQRYGLSIIETPESLRGKRQYEKWRAEENNQPTWRTAIRQDVDEAIQQSLTWRQFLGALEHKGYEVRMGRKYPVLRPPGKERFVRFKTLGKRYTPEAIQTRILYPRSYRPYVENPPAVQHGRLHSGKNPRRKLTGLRALYYANLSLPKDTFLSALATMRSRAIFCSIIVQNMAQLKAMYKDDWKSLVGLCDEFLYLGGTEKETHKYVSELLGKETISTTSYNQSKGRSGSYSINHQQSGRDLVTPDEVRLLDNSKCILFIRGERPVVDLKYNLLKHPNIHCTEDGGAAPYDYTAADNALDDLPGAPENYELLDMDDFLPAEAAEMKLTIQRIRRPK